LITDYKSTFDDIENVSIYEFVCPKCCQFVKVKIIDSGVIRPSGFFTHIDGCGYQDYITFSGSPRMINFSEMNLDACLEMSRRWKQDYEGKPFRPLWVDVVSRLAEVIMEGKLNDKDSCYDKSPVLRAGTDE
jgi:hypothetical protein